MAISRKSNGNYQARVVGPDGKVLTRVFATKRDAELQELKWKQDKSFGNLVPNFATKLTVDDYSKHWFETMEHRASPGWRGCQKQFYSDYIQPIIGSNKMVSVTPQHVIRVMGELVGKKKSEQTQLHVYNLLRKMFRDSVDIFQLMIHNPVLPTLKPKVNRKEAKYLSVDQAKKLLAGVDGRPYDTAIWLQLYLGLRVSEVIALTWAQVNLERGTVLISRSYSRKDTWVTKTKTFNNKPKGGREHTKLLPLELWQYLKRAKLRSQSEFVAHSPFTGEMLSYEFYLETLKLYCRELEIPSVGTHGLRHSASELYLSYGATEADISRLFDHSSPEVTERYLHNRGRNLERVAEVIRLFPNENDPKMTPAKG